MATKKLFTLLIVSNNGRVLLGKKLRGVGENFYNGFGGKVEAGERILDAAIREFEEETGGCRPVGVHQVGILTFNFVDDPLPWEVHVFGATDLTGEPRRTDEMDPVWFDQCSMPYDEMWPDDRLWYPILFRGEKFRGEMDFKDREMLSHNIEVVSAL